MWSAVQGNFTSSSTGYYVLPTGSLLISPVKQSHGTSYICTNSGAVGATSVPATLYIKAQLSYTAAKDICVDVGSSASLSFLALGYPAPSLYLYKYVQNSWSLVTDKRFVLNQSSVTVTSAQISDTGSYTLRANISAVLSSADLVFTITVTGIEAPRASLLPNSSVIIARESGILSITCSVQDSAVRGVGCNGSLVPSLTTIRWTRNGVPIVDNKDLYTVTNLSAGISTLKSDYLVSELSGLYQCEASNAQGYSYVSTNVKVFKVCEINPCLNGGTCIPDKSGKALCLCSDQNSGDFCENSITKSVSIGEFQTGTTVKWEFGAPRQGSVDLTLASDAGEKLVISVQYDRKCVVIFFTSSLASGMVYEEDLNFPFAQFNTSVIAIVAEEDGFVISAHGMAFTHQFAYKGLPSGKVTVSTTSGTLAIGKRLLILSYQPGNVIYVHGVAPSNGEFSIHLYSTDPQKFTVPMAADIALSMKPLLNESSVILNSLIGGRWGVPQMEKGSPFEPSKPFVVAITWQLYGYEIAINGVHFASYNHRLPFTFNSTIMAQSLDYVYRMKLY